MEVRKKIVSPSVAEIFSTMEYGPAPESDKIVQQWLEDHDRAFGHFINNEWVKPKDRKTCDSISPANKKLLAELAAKDPLSKEIIESRHNYLKNIRAWTQISDQSYLNSLGN